jgi:primosomal protein N' (replication factor Y) (superfamily II helicase)
MLVGVIVDLSVWGLNKELTYSVPPDLVERVRIGSIVRVPLRNRRVRGWVVSVDPAGEPPEGTVALAAVSGRGPVFDGALLEMAKTLARRYVSPLSSFLSLFTPMRLGRRAALWPETPLVGGPAPGERVLWRLKPGEDPLPRYAGLVEAELATGRGVILAVPEVREGSRILGELAERFPAEAAVVHSGVDPADRSKALWEVASGRRRLVLGGRAALFAPAFPVGAIVLHQEHDPSFKEQQSPYYDARVVAEARAAVTGARLVAASPTPSLNPPYWPNIDPDIRVDGAGWRVEEADRLTERAAWPATEVVPPPRRGLPQRAIACIIDARKRGERSIILLPRVQATASGPGPEELISFLHKVVPGARVARADRPGLGSDPGALQAALKADVVIATEAGLADVPRPAVSVAIALGVDGYFSKPKGRAAEDAMAALWALAGLVGGRRPKGRLILEVHTGDHHGIEALVRGDYKFFVRKELEARREADAPPFMSMVRLQTPDPSPELMDRLRELPATRVLGPAPGGNLGYEILLKTGRLQTILDPLGTIVSTASQRVLVEVDPKDW